MELQHVNAKFPVDGELTIDPEEIIKVFHRWTAEQSMTEILIDVADYRHVPDGPGVVLVGHEADYAFDNGGGRWGLLYNRKAALDGTNQDRFHQAVCAAVQACVLLEHEFESLRFSRQELEIVINDRALAPSTPETWEVCRADLETFLNAFLGHGDFTLEFEQDPRRRFGAIAGFSRPYDFEVVGARSVAPDGVTG